jgi:hypothetical protein
LADHDIAEIDWGVGGRFFLDSGGFAGFEGAFDDWAEVVGEGFLAEEVEGPEFHGLDDGVSGREGGGEDDHDLGVLLAETFEDLDAVDGFEVELGDDEVGFEGAEDFEPFFCGGCGGDADAIRGEVALGPLEEVGFGVDDENVLHPWAGRGNGTMPDKYPGFNQYLRLLGEMLGEIRRM